MSETKNNEEVALTIPQHHALDKLRTEWQSAYTLQESRNVLNALVRKGLAEQKCDSGSLFFPRTQIQYRRK